MPHRTLATLRAVTNQMARLERDYWNFLGLGPGQARILEQVVRKPGTTQSTICLDLHLDRSTVSRAVKRLEEACYLVRRRAEHEKGTRRLHPGPQAPLLNSLGALAAGGLETDLLAGLDAEEKRHLTSLLGRILANIALARYPPNRPRPSFT